MPPTLRPYQIAGAEFLAARRFALLADSPGLGKTAQVVTALDRVGAKNVLVICPASVRETWRRETRKFSTRGPEAMRLQIFSYEGWARLHKMTVATLAEPFDALIVDESHFCKNPDAARTQAVLGKGFGAVHHAKRRWLLTGTPLVGSVADLWAPLFVSGQTKLGYWAFAEKYCEVGYTRRRGPGGLDKHILGSKPEALPEIKELLSTIMLRRTKETAGIDLPPMTMGDLWCENMRPKEMEAEFFREDGKGVLTREDLTEYSRQANRLAAFLDFSQMVERPDAELLAQLAEISPHLVTLRRINSLIKARQVAALVKEELSNNQYRKVILFACFKDTVALLEKELAEFQPVTVQGSTSQADRTQAVDLFQGNDQTRVFIANITAAGTGITLTAASNVIFVDQEWTPAANAQAMQRAHRIGQTESVFVRFATIPSTIDERVSEILKRKSSDFRALFGDL